MGLAAPITHGGVIGAIGAEKIKERWGGTGTREVAVFPFRLFFFLPNMANYGSGV